MYKFSDSNYLVIFILEEKRMKNVCHSRQNNSLSKILFRRTSFRSLRNPPGLQVYPFAPSLWRQSRGDIIRTVETYVSRGPSVVAFVPRSVIAAGIERRRGPGFCARRASWRRVVASYTEDCFRTETQTGNPRGCPHRGER